MSHQVAKDCLFQTPLNITALKDKKKNISFPYEPATLIYD